MLSRIHISNKNHQHWHYYSLSTIYWIGKYFYQHFLYRELSSLMTSVNIGVVILSDASSLHLRFYLQIKHTHFFNRNNIIYHTGSQDNPTFYTINTLITFMPNVIQPRPFNSIRVPPLHINILVAKCLHLSENSTVQRL